jgi:maltose-binding protein MalE
MMMAGGGFVDANNNIDFANPGNIKAFEFIRALNKNTPTGIVGAPQEGPWWDAFMQQKIAFVVDGPWRMESAKAAGIETGYSTLPKPKGGIDANVTIGVVFYSVPTYAKNKEGGFRLIETLIDPALQQMIVDFNQRSPVLKSYLNDKKFMSSYLATFYMGLQGQVSCLPTFKGNQSAKIWDVFCQNMTRAIVTDENIGTILANTKSIAEKMQ